MRRHGGVGRPRIAGTLGRRGEGKKAHWAFCSSVTQGESSTPVLVGIVYSPIYFSLPRLFSSKFSLSISVLPLLSLCACSLCVSTVSNVLGVGEELHRGWKYRLPFACDLAAILLSLVDNRSIYQTLHLCPCDIYHRSFDMFA